MDGIKIDPTSNSDGRYIKAQQVKEINRILEQVSYNNLIAAYNQEEMIENNVYGASIFTESNWEYIFSHVDTMKKAFAKATEMEDNIVIHFH